MQSRPRSDVRVSSDLHSTTSNPGSSGRQQFLTGDLFVQLKTGVVLFISEIFDAQTIVMIIRGLKSPKHLSVSVSAVLVHGPRYVVLPQTAGRNWDLCGSWKWFWPEGWNLSLQVRSPSQVICVHVNIYIVYTENRTLSSENHISYTLSSKR